MGYVYLMESIRDYDTIYKIGYSKNPNKRIKNIQTGNDGLVKIIEIFETKHGKKLEVFLHNLYSHKRKNMEWFDLNIDDINSFKINCSKIENSLDIFSKLKSEENFYI